MIRVSYEGFDVGRVTRCGNGALRFDYEPRWLATNAAFPVSINLSLTEAPIIGGAVEAWLRGLLPRGEVRARVAEALGLSVDDTLALIARLGGDTPGGLVFDPEEAPKKETPQEPRRIPGEEALSSLFDAWRRHPLLAGDPEIAVSDGRVEPWIPVVREDDAGDAAEGLALPRAGGVSTHWLVPEPESGSGMSENRAFSLELARACGLPVVGFHAGRAGARRYLLIERPDRQQVRAGGWIRRHTETLAQATGRAPEAAHQRERRDGLGFDEVFGLADTHLSATDRLRLLDLVIFRTLIDDVAGDGADVRLGLTGGVRLAPIADVTAIGPWSRRERRQAHRFRGRRLRSDQVSGADWRALAESCKLNPTFTVRRVSELAERVASESRAVADRLCAARILRAPAIDYFERQVVAHSAQVADRARG